MPEQKKRHPALRLVAFFCVVFGVPLLGFMALTHPKSPVPQAWNPVAPFHIEDPVTALTRWKFNRVLANDALCLATLTQTAEFTALPDFHETPQCSIIPQVELRATGIAKVKAVRTRCQTALRLAMWDRHGVQPAAKQHLNTAATSIHHYSSYNCRAMRTGGSGAPRMSTHATGDAIDISGFSFEDGSEISLVKGWSGSAKQANFLRAARDSACDWFVVTLSPDYNALHADHFHLQHTGWGLCR